MGVSHKPRIRLILENKWKNSTHIFLQMLLRHAIKKVLSNQNRVHLPNPAANIILNLIIKNIKLVYNLSNYTYNLYIRAKIILL